MYSNIIEYIRNKYNMTIQDMETLFCIDKETYFKMLELHPRWIEVAQEIENIF